MATRGRSVSLTTSYQTGFDSNTDGGPCLYGTVYASGNDVTVKITYYGGNSDEFLCASGQTFARMAPSARRAKSRSNISVYASRWCAR